MFFSLALVTLKELVYFMVWGTKCSRLNCTGILTCKVMKKRAIRISTCFSDGRINFPFWKMCSHLSSSIFPWKCFIVGKWMRLSRRPWEELSIQLIMCFLSKCRGQLSDHGGVPVTPVFFWGGTCREYKMWTAGYNLDIYKVKCY